MPNTNNPKRPASRARSLRYLAEAVERTLKIIEQWPPHACGFSAPLEAANLRDAQEKLRGTAAKLDELPEKWPPRKRTGIYEGSFVRLLDKHAHKYEGLWSLGDYAEVLHVKPHVLQVKTPTDTVLVVQRCHVGEA